MKKYIPIFLLVGFLVSTGLLLKFFTFSIFPTPNTVLLVKAIPTRVPYETSDMLWSLIQNWRSENNLKPYIKDQRLCDLAKERLGEIQTDYTHDKFLEREFEYVISENISAESPVQATFHGWLESPGHLHNLLADYTYSCVAFENKYAVQLFSNFE